MTFKINADTTDTQTLAEIVRAAPVVHDLAKCPAAWDYEALGDYVLNEDGTKKHADDCVGCASRHALDALVAAVAALQHERDAAHRRGWMEGRALSKAREGAAEERVRVLEARQAEAKERIAEALTSLATGPAKDGYAYEALGDALRVLDADTPEEDAPCPSCGMGEAGTWDTHFDRSLCACGAMHHYCNECGRSVEDCESEEAGA